MPEESPFDVMSEAYFDAKEQMAGLTRMIRADVVSPADPNARRLTAGERLTDFDDFMSNPARRESEFQRLKERYRVPDGQVPRRLLEYIQQGLTERRRAEKS